MYQALNQYHVVMEAEPRFWQNPDGLKQIYVRGNNGAQVPLSAFTHYAPATAPLSVNHQGQFPSVTLSFNLPIGVALGDAVTAIDEAEREINLPANIHGSFQGTAQAYQESLANEPILIAAALVAVYIVLGRAVRKPDSSHHHSFHAAVGRSRRAAGAAASAHRTDRDRAHRDHPADRNRQEERDHDDRLRAGSRAQGKQEPGRIHFSGLPAAIPAHHDDHHGGAAGRPAARDRRRHRFGIAPAARNLDRGRPDFQPDAYPVHHAGHLPVSGPDAAAKRKVAREAIPERRRRKDREHEEVFYAASQNSRRAVFAGLALLLTSACMVGPKYSKPTTPAPPAFKEQLPPEFKEANIWKPGEPRDDKLRGKWWEVYNDPQLNALEDQVKVSNLNIAQSEAQFRAGARSGSDRSRGSLPHRYGRSFTATRSHYVRKPWRRRAGLSSSELQNDFQIPVDASYEVDAWGRVRNTIAANIDTAQASAADLETIRLSMHAELATDYFQLRGLDAQKQLARIRPSSPTRRRSSLPTTGIIRASLREWTWSKRERNSKPRARSRPIWACSARNWSTPSRCSPESRPRSSPSRLAPLARTAARGPGCAAIRTSGAPPRYRQRGASRGLRECADRRRDGRVLSHHFAQRRRRRWKAR